MISDSELEILEFTVSVQQLKFPGFKLALYLADRYLGSSDVKFVEIIQSQIEKFAKKYKSDCVLLFPPVNSYQRLLIHQTSQRYPGLHSFSVGEGGERRTVVCYQNNLIGESEDTELMSSCRPPSSRGRGRGKFKDNSPTPSSRQSNENVLVIQSEEKKSDKQILRSPEKPKHLRDPVKQSRARNKKPEIQVYVPKGRRLLQEQKQHEQQQQRDQSGGDDGGESGNVDESETIAKKSMDTNKQVPLIGDGLVGNERVCKEVQNDSGVSEHQTLPLSDNIKNVSNQSSETDSKVGRKQRGKNQVYIPPYRRHCMDRQVSSEECQKSNEVENSESRKNNLDQPAESELNDQSDNLNSKRNCVFTSSPSAQNVSKRAKKTDFIETKSNIATKKHSSSGENSQSVPAKDLIFVDCEKNNIPLNNPDFWNNKEHYLYADMNTKNSASMLEPEIDDGTAEYLRNEYLQAIGDNDFHIQKNLFYQHCDGNNKMAADTCEEEADDNGIVQEIDLEDIEIHSQEDVSIDKNLFLLNESKNSLERQQENVDSVSINGSDNEDGYALCPEEPDDKLHVSDNSKSGVMGDNKLDLSENAAIESNMELENKLVKVTGHKGSENIQSECLDKGPYVDKLDISDNSVTNCDISNMRAENVESQKTESPTNQYEKSSTNQYEENYNVKTLNQNDIRNESDSMGIQDSDVTNCDNQELKDKSSAVKTKTDKKRNSGTSSSKNTSHEIQDSTDDASKERENKEYVRDWSSESSVEEEDEDSWDKMFDEDGECLDPKGLEELTSKVGKVKIKKATIDYYNHQPKDPQLDYEELGHIIEIYDFPAEFTTRDLLTAFQQFSGKGFDIKWVDDTHALAVFASAIAAKDALKMTHPLLKVRCLSESARQCKVKARKCTEFLQPYKPRPETSAVTARRLVTGALGLAPKLSKEQREKERKVLKEAREKKKQDRKQRDDIWEGNYKTEKLMDT